MSIKLRELIRQVRACKSAAEERKVIAQELAKIRTAFKEKDKLEYRHHNVAKLMFVDMLGYPTHFGQMEVLKLLASKMFPEKRLGYLALMQLLDENAEVLMLATQSMKRDMANENAYIVSLSLCAFANIASTDQARDLSPELEQLLRHPNPYIRKKALCSAMRVVKRVPDCADDYFKLAVQTLEDNSQTHGPLIAAVQLLIMLCQAKPKLKRKMRKYSQHVLNRLNSLLRSSYDPDHDIGGVTDPFLQVNLLKLLRTISTGIGGDNSKLSDEVDATLAQIATNTESNKNPGNSILYECVKTIMSIEAQGSLHVLAINILGRFLVNRDNNVRYVALNALCDAVESNTMAIQRHRNTIVECLKDADITIRRRALDLIYALTNSENIESLVRDLLGFLVLSSSEPEFQQELASKICMVVERYAPNRKWHIDTVFDVMSTVGSFKRDDVISSLFIIISNTPELQAYATYKLFKLSSKRKVESDHLKRLAAWCIGEYGLLLIDDKGAQLANDQAPDDEDGPFRHYSEEDIIRLLKTILRTEILKSGQELTISSATMNTIRHKVSSSTKAFVLTALMKLLVRFSPQYTDSIRKLIDEHKRAVQVEIQQRAVEYLTVVDATPINLRSEILKPMPVPDITRLTIDRSMSQLNGSKSRSKLTESKISDDDGGSTDNGSTSGTDTDTDGTGSDTDSDEETSEERRKRQRKEKRKKEKLEKEKRKDKHRKSPHKKDKHKKSPKNGGPTIIPTLAGPGGDANNNNGTASITTSSTIDNDLNLLEDIGSTTTNGTSHKKESNNDDSIFNLDQMFSNDSITTPQTTTTSSTGGMNILDDIIGIPTNNNANNTNQTSGGGISALMGLGSPNQSNQTTTQTSIQSQNQIPSITAFEKDGIKATFNFVKTNQPGLCRILAVFINTSDAIVDNFSFMVAVPKYIKLQIKPATGTSLQPMGQNTITQKIQLTNSAHEQKPLIIRIQVQYTRNGQKVQEIAQVNKFPENCAN